MPERYIFGDYTAAEALALEGAYGSLLNHSARRALEKSHLLTPLTPNHSYDIKGVLTRVGAAGATALSLIAGVPSTTSADANCQFILGFKTLHDALSQDIGNCVENQHFAPNGDAQQHTDKGLLAWREDDNWTAFTNGYWTWVNGPYGIQKRLNDNRFPFESDKDTTVRPISSTIVVVPSPTASLSPSPSMPVLQQTPEAVPAPTNLTVEGVVNNPNVQYIDWDANSINTLRSLERESIIRAGRVDYNNPQNFDGSFQAALGDKRQVMLQAVSMLDNPVSAASRIKSISVSGTGNDWLGWWGSEGAVQFHPGITTKLPDVNNSQQQQLVAISTVFKEWISLDLYEKLVTLGVKDPNVAEKGARYLQGVFVQKGLTDVDSSEVNNYANWYKQFAFQI